MENKNFIGRYGLFATLVVTLLGEGLFSYPREVTAVAWSDGWWITMIGGIIAFGLLYMIYKVVKLNNFHTLDNILIDNFGNIIGKILCMIFIIFNLGYISVGIRIFAELIKLNLLPKTPKEVIVITMILTGTSLVNAGIRAVVKFNEVGFWIMIVPIFIIFLFLSNKADFTNVLPVFSSTFKGYARGVTRAIYCFVGIQIAFMVLPHIINREKVHRDLRNSIIFTTITYVLVVVLSIGVFGKAQSTMLLWPTISLIRSINVQGGFFENWEGVVMVFWIMYYFLTFINIYYFGANIFTRVLNCKRVSISTVIFAPIIYFVSLLPDNIAQVYNLQNNFLYYLGFITVIVIPVVLLISSKQSQKRRHGNES